MDSDFPSGGGGGMSGGAVEEDFTKMALEDRLSSKVWKARVSGYEELIRSFEKSPSDSAPVFKPFTRNPDSVKAIVTDSNAVAQEKGVEAVRAFLKYGGKAAGSTREVVLPSLVEKCFGAMRAGTKKAALEVVQLYAEMEDVLGCEGLIQDLLKGTMAKQPKVVATSVMSLCELIRDFGPKQVSPKLIVKKLPDLFGHSDKLVRAEASSLAKEVHLWIGAALEPTISSLKDIQAKELREQFAQLDSAGERHTSPKRYLFSQVPAPETKTENAGGPSGTAGTEPEASDEPIDPLEFAEPSDPLKAKDWPENFDEMIASAKWLERKDVLVQCLKVLDATPKIIHTMPIDSVIDVLCEKVKKDSNINVALVACQCLTRLAMGLRSNFAKNKDKALPALLEKLKEKKESTVKIVSDTLDAVFLTVSLGEILEQTLNATKHKNPAVKAGSIQFLARCLKETRQMPAKADVKPIAEALVTAMGDGSADVREAGAQGLGTLMKLIGERAMNQFIDGLDDIKKGKIQDAFKEATVKVKQASAPNAPSPAAAPSRPPVGAARAVQAISAAPAAALPRSRPAPVVTAASAAIEKENVSPTGTSRPSVVTAAKGPPARLAVKKPGPAPTSGRPAIASTSRPAATSNGAAGKPGKAALAAANDPIKYRFHQDEADAKAVEVIPSNLVEEISNSVWKDRLAGMVKFNEWLKMEAAEVESELIVRFLSKKPGWKESNFQVMAEVYAALRMLAQECPTFARASVALSITPLCEKLGDMKLKGPAGETLTLYAEKTSFGFVLMQALTPLANIKAPKAIADSLVWVDESLLAFGTGGVDVRSVIDYLLTCLKSANAGVRTNATLVIRTLARFLGTALVTFLGDLNPQLKSIIEAEIEKASREPPPAPTRFSEEGRAKPGTDQGPSGTGGKAAAAEEDALDSLIPRVDLDQIMPSVAIARSGDANWKERKEGLEDINAILDANTRLKPNIGQVGTALKLRFSDNNMQVRMLALDAIAKIANGMNQGFADHARTFVAPVTQVLADAKVPIRAAASKTLTAIAQQVGPGPMIPGFCSVLESKVANPMLKQDLFTWLGEWFEANPPEKGLDLNGLALPAIHCLDDKLAGVRKAAQSVLPFIIMRAGYKYVMEQTNSLKTASRNTVVPLVDAAKAQAMAKAPRATAAAPPASVGATKTPANVASSSISKMPNVVRKATTASAAATSSSDGPSAASLVETSSDMPSATPRKGLMKPPSLVGRSLKPTATPLGDHQRADLGSHESRPAAPRMSIVRRPTMTTPATSSTPILAAKTPPFVSQDGKFKAAREKRETGRGAYWIGPEATSRPELVEVLRSQCEHHLSGPLLDSMFSKDHNAERDYLSALTVLVDYASNPASAQEEYGLSTEEAIARLLANSDLVFKYVAIRLTDNNTSISLKCIDLVEQLLGMLRQQEYHMSDYEANAIVPCLIAKFGDPRAPFRDRIRQEVFRKLTFIYPPSKILMHYVEEGLVSKNVRVRTECLGELGYLFSKNGAQICSLPKTLPAIAQQISDRDNGVRTAALLAIGEVYKILGEEETWKCVGKLPLKESGLLEERLKRTTAPARAIPAPSSDGGNSRTLLPPSRANPTASVPVTTSSALPSPAPARKLPVPSRLARPTSTIPSGIQPPGASKGSRIMAPPASSAVSGIARPGSLRPTPSSSSSPPPSVSSANGTAHRRTASSASSAAAGEDGKSVLAGRSRASVLQATEDDAAVEQVINEILSSDSDRSVMALKRVDAEIQGLAPSLLRHADQLTIAFGKQLHRAFNVDRGVASNDRLKKNLLFTGISMFDNTRVWEHDGAERTLGSFITKAALISLLTELLQRLIETSGATDEETQAHGRYLNIIVLRTFSSCNLNVLFGACLAILTEATEDLEDLQQKGDEAILQKRVKFSELIVKCLWKITRKLNASLQEDSIDPSVLLQDLEQFLQAIPPSEWKRRASIGLPLGEMPLRTIKVIITHIGSCFGEEALDLLEKIPNAEGSHVYKFLLRVCDRNGAATGLGVEEEEKEVPSSPAISRHGQSSTKLKTPLSSPLKEQLKSPQMDRDWSRASSAQDDPEAAINLELRSIFDRIAQKSESRAAIRDLYLFQRKYPHKEANIQRSLQSTGPIFQKFIKRALANHAADDDQAIMTGDGAGMPEKRDSVASLVSPTSARSSAAIDWTATAASLGRASLMSPPSNRTSFSALPVGLNASPNPSATSGSPNMRRDSATDDRLAQLRAKFTRSTSGASESSTG